MGSNTAAIAADAGDLELEAMSKDDCSWHPCQVQLSPNGAALVINYGNGSKDTLVNEKEAQMRIRVRSLPLQDDDCTQIKPGEHVVVNRNSESAGGFFDAEVEKVLKVRHSKRTQCRCSFMIRWLHDDLNGGSLKVPSSSVMRLADKSINNHPTISSFIDAVLMSNSSFSSMSPPPNVVSELDLDLHDLLEKQIEGIRNSVHGSKKKIRDEILDFEEQIKGTDISMLNAEIQNSTAKSRPRRSNWIQEVLQSADVKNPTSSEGERLDIRSPLNPLAARAALASLMSQNLEVSFNEEDKLSLETEVTPKAVKITKKSTRSSTQASKVSSKMNPATGTRSTRSTVKKVEGIPDNDTERNSSIDGSKSNRRSTRSGLGKEGERVTAATRSEGYDEDKQTVVTMPLETNSISSNRRRLTRSTINKEAVDMTTETTKESAGDEVPISEVPSRGTEKIQDVNLSPAEGSKKRAVSGGAKKVGKTDSKFTDAGVDLLPTDQINKKRNKSSVASATQDSEGDGGSKRGSKKNTFDLKQQKVRSSPRFRPKA